MSLKPKIEAIIYAAETPITLDQIVALLRDSATEGADLKSEAHAAIEELVADYSSEAHGIELRQIARGYRMSTKPEQHDLVRSFAKSLKPPIRLSLQALETLAVIAYKQPVTVPEISEIRGVDSSGVIASCRPLSRSRPVCRAASTIAFASRSRRRGSSPSASEYSSSNRSLACRPGGSLPVEIGGVMCPMVTAPSRRLAVAASPGLLTMNG